MKRLSADQNSSHLALDLWRRSRSVLSIGFKDSLTYFYYNKNVSRIECSVVARGRTVDTTIGRMEP